MSQIISLLQQAIFRKEGEYWTVGCVGNTFRLKDSKGVAYLAHLLRYPDAEFHALDLAAGIAERSSHGDADRLPRDEEDLEKAGIHIGNLGDAGEVLDNQAKSAYRRRLSELSEELREAKELGKIDRAEQLEDEIDALNKELSRALGLDGRDRRVGSASERARQSVSKMLKLVVEKIAHSDAALGSILRRSVSTGNFCSYRPDPDFPILWEFSANVIEAPPPSSQGDPAAAQADLPQSMLPSLPVSLFPLAERTTFVGRENESSVIRSAIDRARKGNGSVVMLGGGPGVGKTRLATEMAEYAASNGFASYIGHCYEREEPFPYLPFVEIIESSLAQAPSAGDYRREIGEGMAGLAQLAPSLRRFFPDIPKAEELPASQKRRYLFQNLSEALARAARIRPQLYIVDDLQWADEATLDLLTHVTNILPQLSVVIIGTYRDEFSEPNPALVRTLEEMIRLGIRPMKVRSLSKDAVARMLVSLGRCQPPQGLVNAIFQETNGNPFFVEEVYRYLLEDGKAFDNAWQFRNDVTIEAIKVPESVRLIIDRRLGRFDANEKQVLSAAAVIGRSFSFQLLAAISRMTMDELFIVIEKAQAMGIIIPSSDGPERPLIFSHDLVRQTLLAGISPPRQQRMHASIAEAIERLDAKKLNEQASLLAHHLHKAGDLADPSKAASYFCMAGKNALEGAAYEEAYRSFETAASYETDLRRRAECLQGMERANRGLGRWQEALHKCNEAVEVYRELGDTEMTANGIYEAVDALLLMGQYQAAAEMGQHGLAELKDGASATRGDILAALGLIYAVSGDYAPARDALSEALSIAERLSDPRLLAGVHTNFSVLNGLFLELADDLSNSRAALEWKQSGSFPWMRAVALNEQMMASHQLGRLDEATRVSEELQPLARKIGHVVFLATSIWTNAWAEFGKAPNLTRLEEQLGQSVELCRTSVPMIHAQSLAQLSLAKLFLGNQSAALDCALEASQLEVPGYLGGYLAGMIFRLRAYASDHVGAMALLNEALANFKLPSENQPNTFGSWAFLVSTIEGLAMLGEREQAGRLYPLVCDLLRTGMVTFPMVARFPQTIAGVAAAAAGQWDAAEEHFQLAMQHAKALPHRIEQADIRRFHAMVLMDRAGPVNRERARTLVSEALDAYIRNGMLRHVEVTQALLDRAVG